MLGLLGLNCSLARAEQWLELFGQAAITGSVRSVADFENKLYVSGNLFSAADQRAAGLATYDYETGQWAAVQMDFGEGFISMAGFTGDNDNSLFLAPECCSKTLIRLRNNIKTEVQLGGYVNELISVNFDVGPRVVATGAFEVEQQNFSLAVWDGEQWRYQASLVTSVRNPVIVQQDGRNHLVAFARYQQTQLLVVWDGSHTSYHEIPTTGSIRAIAAANGLIYACTPDRLLSWDGSSWANVPLYIGYCLDLASRPTVGGQELVIGTLSGQLLFTDGRTAPSPDANFPGVFAPYRISTIMISTASKFFFIGGQFVENQYQFTVWDGVQWTFPQADFQSTRDLATIVESDAVVDRVFLFGDFLNQASGERFSTASWLDQGLTKLEAGVDNTPISAVSSDLTTFYGASPEGLVVATADSSRTIPFSESICSLEYSDGFGEQVFFSDCRGSVYQFDGNEISPAGQGQSSCYRCYGELHAIRKPSPAAALYAVAVVGANADTGAYFSSMRIRRWSGIDWQDITPPEFASPIFSSGEIAILSSFHYQGSEKLFAAIGSHFGYYDGSSWFLFPELPDRTLLGPVASFQQAGTTCFLVAEHRQIDRYCAGQWQRPASLALHPRNLNYQSFGMNLQLVKIMQSSTYLGHPVILVAGHFDAAGNSTQGHFAVLDLEILFADGMEF